MNNMNCELCGTKLRKCKRIDIVDRKAHFSCINRFNQEQYDKELAEFVDFLTEQVKKIYINEN
jgi:hypothetical protein